MGVDKQGEDLARIRIDLAYDGTGFHGWAKQGDSPLRTVQGEVEKALSLVLRVPMELTVAGRTDAGVHAAGQVAHFDIPRGALGTRSIDGDRPIDLLIFQFHRYKLLPFDLGPLKV